MKYVVLLFTLALSMSFDAVASCGYTSDPNYSRCCGTDKLGEHNYCSICHYEDSKLACVPESASWNSVMLALTKAVLAPTAYADPRGRDSSAPYVCNGGVGAPKLCSSQSYLPAEPVQALTQSQALSIACKDSDEFDFGFDPPTCEDALALQKQTISDFIFFTMDSEGTCGLRIVVSKFSGVRQVHKACAD